MLVADYQATAYTIRQLNQLTSYTVKIVASDNRKKESHATTQFKTVKFFLKFFKEIEYGTIAEYGSHNTGEMIKANDGGYIITGETGLMENGKESQAKVFIFKIDTAGSVEWRKYYNYSTYNIADLKVVSFMDGYVFGAGRDLVRVDNQGNEIWHRASASLQETIHGIGAGKSGEFYTVGKTGSADPDKEMSASICKYDANGNLIWNKKFTPTNWNEFTDVIVTQENQLIVLGGFDPRNKNRQDKINHNGEDDLDFWVLSLTTDGELIWDKSYHDPGYAFPYKIIQTREGNFVMAGFTMTQNTPLYLVMINASGDPLWTYFNEELPVKAKSVAESDDHSIIVTGIYQTPQDAFYSLVKFNKEGQKLWVQEHFEFNTILKPKSVIPVNDGGYIINCQKTIIYSNAFEYDKIYLFKTDENGYFN
ncbi:MAG: hypothetical protein BGP13_13495 [Sphingobacteriales bacterium 40-81]|nr:MAG: hypothetical protein BGP13_13495 [Sphingobacteriales bacterium 40-81]